MQLPKETLEGVDKVSASSRLISSPAMIVNSDKMMTAQMKKMMKALQKTDAIGDAESKHLEINPTHPLIKNLANLQKNNSDLSELIALQILDTAKVSAGLIEDPSSLVERNYKIMEVLSTKASN